jgi:hypothetical protein
MRKIVVASIATMLLAGVGAPVASAHRSGCHGAHSCPSDHATYRWQGKLCVKPTADERTSAFKKKVHYAGLTYYCK